MAEHVFATDPPAGTRITLALWTGVLLAPTAWVAHLLGSYAVATVGCEAPSFALHAITLASLGAAILGGVIAWRTSQHLQEGPDVDPDRLGRRRFMGWGGVALSALFIFVIAVEAVPSFLLRPCE
jgi:hypothetical protein